MSEVVVRPLQAHEWPQAAAFITQMQAASGGVTADNELHTFWLRHRPKRPGFKFAHYRAAFDGEQLCALAGLSQHTLHYGRAHLRVAMLHPVLTHPDFCGAGYAAAVLRDVLTYSTEQGAHLVLRDGVAHYYERFGFSPVWPRYTLQSPVEAALQLEAPLQIHAARQRDLPYIAALYNRLWQGRVTFSRTPQQWQWLLQAPVGTIVVAIDAQQRIHGYLWHTHKLASQVEVLAQTQAGLSTLMVYSAQLWQAAGETTLTWLLPPDDVIIPYAQQLLPITLSAHYAPSGHWMARLIDSSALLKKLLPEIAAQAKEMQADFDAADLVLDVESDAVDIGLRKQAESHCRLSLRDFIQVLFGSLRPTTLAVREDLTPEAVTLLELLFPPRIASIAALDTI